MDKGTSEGIATVSRKLREVFDEATSKEKFPKVLQWLCSETNCRLILYFGGQKDSSGERFLLSIVQDSQGDKYIPTSDKLLPSMYKEQYGNIWFTNAKVTVPEFIRQKYRISSPLKEIILQVRRKSERTDLVLLAFDENTIYSEDKLKELMCVTSCFGCLLDRYEESIESEIQRRQREFLKHLYETTIPCLKDAYIRVLESAIELVDARRYAIWTVNHHSKTLTLVGEYKYHQGLEQSKILSFDASFVGMGVEAKKPIYIESVFHPKYDKLTKLADRKLQNLIVLPILEMNDGVPGSKVAYVLALYPVDPDYEFDEKLFNTISGNIAIYLGNSEKVEQQRFLQFLLQCSVGAQDLHEYLGNVVNLIVKEIGVQGCSIFYYDYMLDRLALGATSGLIDQPPIKTVYYGIDEAAATVKCFNTGVPVRHDDIALIRAEEMIRKYREQTKDKGKTFIAVPIKNPAGAITGVLRCTNKVVALSGEVDYFSDTTMSLLEFVGRIVGYHLELRIQDKRRNEILDRTMHEVNNPASAIRITAEILRKHAADMPPMRLNAMLINIEEYAKLLDWLAESVTWLTLHKSERLKRYKSQKYHIVDIIKDVRSLIRPVARSRQRRFENIKFPSRQFDIFCDRDCLIIILLNLVSNAVKYCDEAKGDDFDVTVESELLNPYIAPRSKKNYGNACVVKVTDWGIGITNLESSRIFEAGFQGKNAIKVDDTGQGLGLSLVKMVTEDLGGEVFLEHLSKPTIFTVVLPQKG
jgi:signal transduction histidine kinase